MVIGPVTDGGIRQIAVDELVVVDLRRTPGWVRPVEGQAQKERPCRVTVAEEIQGPGDKPEFLHLVFEKEVGPADPGIRGDAVGELFHPGLAWLPCQPFAVVLARCQLLESKMSTRRVEVSLADVDRLVTAISQGTGKSVIIVPWFAVLIADHTLGVGRHTRHQRATGGDAGGAGRVGAGESGATRRQRVEVRGVGRGMTEPTKTVAAPVIGENEEQIRTGCSHVALR